MRRCSVLLSVFALLAISCKQVPPENAALSSVSDSTKYFVVGEYDTLLKKSQSEPSELETAVSKCKLEALKKYEMTGLAHIVGEHYLVSLKAQPTSDCQFKSGYVLKKQIAEMKGKFPVDANEYLGAFDSKASLYTIENNAMEGGAYDRCDYHKKPENERRRLSTLEEFLAGKSNWVALAMDRFIVPYGTIVRIPEIEDGLRERGVYPGGPIFFVVTDGGGAFDGITKWGRFDLCVGNSQADVFSANFNWIHGKTYSVKILRRGSVKAPECGLNFRDEFL